MRAFKRFAQPGVHLQSWYPALRASKLAPGSLRTVELLDRRIVFYRQAGGQLGAMDADCPHLGTDLGQGSLTPSGIRCAFHGWCFGSDGACVSAPGSLRPPQRAARSYPVQEAWGWLWVFNGPKALFPLPCAELGAQGRVIKVWTERMPHHSHVLAANGIDTMHFQVVHDVDHVAKPGLSQADRFRTAVELKVRPRKGWLKFLTGSQADPIEAAFSTLAGNMAIGEVRHPLRFLNFFAGCPVPGGTDWHIFLIIPKGNGWRWFYGLGLMLAILPDDVPVLKGLRFHPGMVPADRGLMAFAAQVEALPTY